MAEQLRAKQREADQLREELLKMQAQQAQRQQAPPRTSRPPALPRSGRADRDDIGRSRVGLHPSHVTGLAAAVGDSAPVPLQSASMPDSKERMAHELNVPIDVPLGCAAPIGLRFVPTHEDLAASTASQIIW